MKRGWSFTAQRARTVRRSGKNGRVTRACPFFFSPRSLSRSLDGATRRGLKKDLAAREGGVESARRGIPEFHELRRRVDNVGASIILVGIERRIHSLVVGLVGRAAVEDVWRAQGKREGETTPLRADRSSSTTASLTRANPLSRYFFLCLARVSFPVSFLQNEII